MLIYPAPGLRVRDPQTLRHVPDEGLEVSEHSTFWAKRLRDGDVVLTKPTVKSAPQAPLAAPAAAPIAASTAAPGAPSAPSEKAV